MKTLQLVQGEPEWHAHRAKHFNASDAPAMLGISKYVTRSALIKQLATGTAAEPDEFTKRRYADGHAYEAQARPWAEEIIGEELFPVTVAEDVDGLPLSASLDGMTMAGDVLFEHKTMNDDLERALADGRIPEEYHPQLEQGLLITGAQKCLFMASRGEKRTERHAWYTPNPALRARLLAGWKQLKEDVAAYQPEAPVAAVVGRAPESLPALLIQVTGAVTQSNLPEFKARAIAVFKSINTDLQTDADFADAEKTVKFCKEIEERLDAAKKQALEQTVSIDELFRAVDEISAEARAKRLELDKAVKSRKEQVRAEIIAAGDKAFREHCATINKRLGTVSLPAIAPNFAGVIRGLKTVASVKDAVSTELARVKIEANAAAEAIDANLRTLQATAADHLTLFPDVQALVLKPEADLIATIKARIADHEAEQRRRAEAAPPPVQPAVPPAAPPTLTAVKPRLRPTGPTEQQVVALVAKTYGVTEATAAGWLVRMDFSEIYGQYDRAGAAA